jgi:hypothetical protein
MTPATFPECNCTFGPPPDLVESQCRSIPAYQGSVDRGSVEGSRIVVVAYKPDEAELEHLAQGGLLFLSMMGGLAPHFITCCFEHATSPA